VCESAPGTPTAPPKKKHCRSLSVPPDSAFGNQPPSLVSREHAARLWKPIALNPVSNLRQGINSPCELDTGHQGNLSPLYPGSSESSGHGSSWLPKLLGPNLQLASAASSDSGHFTTSDFQTPPGSPVPTAATRPASASSDTTSSFGSMSSAWLDFTAGTGLGAGNGSISSQALRGARALQNRSLSCEDRISGSSGAEAGLSGMPGMACTGSIPRCHSQPCVLHHRRCGKKRRRNCDRPTLNFNKMTEVS
ncbi:hypothetical protein EGW08_012805, partial [Elysia chlorotica]